MNSNNSTTIAVVVMGIATIAAIGYAAHSIKGAIDDAATKIPTPTVTKRAALFVDLGGNCPNGGCDPVPMCQKWGYPLGEIVMTNTNSPKGAVCFDEAFKP